MTRTPPAWIRGEEPANLEAAGEKMRQDVAADRVHLRGVGRLPVDKSAAAWELEEGERTLRSSRPKNRRWRALDKIDQEIDRLRQRQAEASARLQEAENVLARAPEDDARALADWLAGSEKGQRPAATLYERQRERDAAQLLVKAAVVELDRANERRLRHVEQHRAKMLEDARQDVDAARAKLLAHLVPLPELRQAILDARDTLIWIASYPDQAESFGFATATALGLRKPIEQTLGTSARVEYTALLQALEKDADTLADTFGPEQKKRLGIADPPTPLREALWDSDPAMVEFKRQELERARQLAEYGNVHALAAEANDYRPDPPDYNT